MLSPIVSTTVLLAALASPTAAGDDDWRLLEVPGSWESRGVEHDGTAWYRAYVRVPENWTGAERSLWVDSLTLSVAGVGDAYEAFVNGTLVGRAGSFPPELASGRDEWLYHRIPAGLLAKDAYNCVALRVHAAGGDGGFLGGAPVIASYNVEIPLAGAWEFRCGDDPAWALGAAAERPSRAVFEDARNSVAPLRRPTALRRGAHLAPAESLALLRPADGLTVELVLAEPEIAQPVALHFDARGRLWVVEYRQYPYPAGLEIVSRDKYFRAVFDRVPAPPPHGPRGADRISVHEDADGDGTFETHAVFVDGLNIATSVVTGRGGVFVLNPPYLLFYADRDGDDVPDGDPDVCLEGFGLEDTHSVVNSLHWGPDGWLYAAQGSTVSGRVRVPGSRAPEVHSMGPLIWRYHPELRCYEIFAEGGGNTFSVELDGRGRLFSGTNAGDTRGLHYVQGASMLLAGGAEAKYGRTSNPFAYGGLPNMEHGNAPRFSHAWVLYEEEDGIELFRGRLVGIEPLQRRLVLSELEPRGSTFRTRDIGRPLESDDPSFRPVAIAIGPDRAVYVADFCEEFIAHGQHYRGQIDPSTGRVFRLRAAGSDDAPRAPPPESLEQATADTLLAALSSPSRWRRETARRVIADRRDLSLRGALAELVRDGTGVAALEGLWGLQASGGLREEQLLGWLAHRDAAVRSWSVRFACDRPSLSPALAHMLRERASVEEDVTVRSELATGARRLGATTGVGLVRRLLDHPADASDPFQPLLLWWALETHCGEEPERFVELLEERALWDFPLVREHLLARIARRCAEPASTRRGLLACARLLELAPDDGARDVIRRALEETFAGRSLSALPEPLLRALEASGGVSLALKVRQGDDAAVREALDVLAGGGAAAAERLELARLFAEVTRPEAPGVLFELAARSAEDADLRRAALVALAAYGEEGVAERLVELAPSLPPTLRETALATLATRPPWAVKLLAAAGSGALGDAELSPAVLVRLRLLADPTVEEMLAKASLREGETSPRDVAARVERLRDVLDVSGADLYDGKRLFRERCGRCHTLFNDAGRIGPDLTPYARDDLTSLLINVLDPNAEVREGFERHIAVTLDGRLVTGLLADSDQETVVLRAENDEDITLRRSDLARFEVSGESLMPAGLLDDLPDEDLRDLFAYLRSSQPVPD